jgi:hypothetical protein
MFRSSFFNLRLRSSAFDSALRDRNDLWDMLLESFDELFLCRTTFVLP